MMISGLNSWLDQLADKQIPILKDRRDQALAILNDEVRSVSECRSIILSDPGMAANLLRVMNKERSKENRLPITTVSSLVSLLGVPSLRKQIQAMTCIEDMQLPAANLKGIYRCLKQSWYCTQFAMKWVTERGVREPEEVHLAAILQCLPELMLWVYGDDAMRQIEHLAYYECLDYFEEVTHVIGCHKREIGVSLAKKWHLPEIAGFAFESEYNSYTSGTAVALGALLARLCMHGWYAKDMEFFLQKAMHYFGENEIKTIKHLHQQALEMAYDEVEQGFRPIISLLLSTDLERAPELEYFIPPENKDTQETTQEVVQKPVQESAEITSPVIESFDQTLLNKDIVQLKVLVKQQAKMNELLKHVILSLHDTVVFGRVSFLLLSADRLKLESKINKFSNADDDSLKQLTIELSKQGLFSLLMKKPQAFTLNKNNYEKYWPLVSGKLKADIQVESFCATSVFFGEKAIGMIYADKPQGVIGTEDFKAFQQLTMMLNKALELMAKNN
ncbi:MAG: HDOD domain-containing protein [Gammaproteobacteria bacterium]|nr:HDOD domain-containing protein [Gammaproteobacteria bacterium]